MADGHCDKAPVAVGGRELLRQRVLDQIGVLRRAWHSDITSLLLAVVTDASSDAAGNTGTGTAIAPHAVVRLQPSAA